MFHLVRSLRCFSPWILPTSGIRADGSSLSLDKWDQFDLVLKVFLMEVSGKRVPYRCVNDGTSKDSLLMFRSIVSLGIDLSKHLRYDD